MVNDLLTNTIPQQVENNLDNILFGTGVGTVALDVIVYNQLPEVGPSQYVLTGFLGALGTFLVGLGLYSKYQKHKYD